MQFARLVAKDIDKTLRDIKAEKTRVRRAGEIASRVEGFRLMKLLKEEIRAGRPGGMRLSPLTQIARRTRRKLNRKPLERLAVPVRYRASRGGDKYTVQVGYLTEDIGNAAVKSRNRISKSWARIVKFQQEGGSIPVTPDLRRALIDIGARLKKRRVREANVFFLKKSTRRLQVKPRPIIAPFWRAYRREAERNIERNFERKMRGERI